MKFNYRNLTIWMILGLSIIIVAQLFSRTAHQESAVSLPYSEFLDSVEADKIKEVTITGLQITGRKADNSLFATYSPGDSSLVERLQRHKVVINAKPVSDGSGSFLGYLLNWLPMIIIVGIWIFILRQMQGGSKGAMGFGKSKAKLLTESQGKFTFKDVAGVDEAKNDLEEIVEFLRDPQKFQRLGGKIPRGVLLVGPPGTGKTLLARAVAGEANVPFFSISGSDFVEMFVGVGASRVRDMFEQAKKNAPCIIFIDEIDAVGRQRGVGYGGGHDEREQTLNQLLVEMDGFEANESIILIAATNRPDVLDPALLRPGRFDRQVVVPNPDLVGREAILKVHVKNVPLAPDVELKTLARGTPGFSGAELMNLVNEAALLAARRNKRLVTMREFEDAKDKVLMGAERRSTAMTEKEKAITAYHEAGHAIVAMKVPVSDPVHKATIIPRGRALGMVMQLPENDRVSISYLWMISKLAIAMGGRAAEELKFGKDQVTAGASSDIEHATSIARQMVSRFGYSEKLGMVAYGQSQEDAYLGRQGSPISGEAAKLIDEEVRTLINNAYAEALRILTEHKDAWVAIAEALLEHETLSGEQLFDVVAGKSIEKLETVVAQPSNSLLRRYKGNNPDNEPVTQEAEKSEQTDTIKADQPIVEVNADKGEVVEQATASDNLGKSADSNATEKDGVETQPSKTEKDNTTKN